ncbi:4Fe-4S dicluster domain-containing protein [Senegalimassilia anaerobia]|uniref:4Fe-4S dicluster domain-containing protein n=1 Tax=Senegalimassilia anaerobia TaxID=1473216 RepID=UPI0025D02E86|nr:4Fe-4S dicluster domain-containing protein [Senegalimassilia anaerobia]
MSHNCIVVNLDRCTGCFGCEIACKMENNVALGQRWSKVFTVGPVGEYPNMTRYALPTMCQQCKDAPCVHVCPTGASYRDSNTNVVLVDKEKCIGCKYCMMACPYGVRSWNKTEKCVEKCTLCGQLTSAGKLPACVKSCAAGARFYGDLDDPNSDVSKELAKYPAEAVHTLEDQGNGPCMHYILSTSIGQWQARIQPRRKPQTAAYPEAN